MIQMVARTSYIPLMSLLAIVMRSHRLRSEAETDG